MKEKVKNELKERSETFNQIIECLKAVTVTTLGMAYLMALAVQFTIGWWMMENKKKSLGKLSIETKEKDDSAGKVEAFIMVTVILLSIFITYIIEDTEFATFLISLSHGF